VTVPNSDCSESAFNVEVREHTLLRLWQCDTHHMGPGGVASYCNRYSSTAWLHNPWPHGLKALVLLQVPIMQGIPM